jgi:hypothetical protein
MFVCVVIQFVLAKLYASINSSEYVGSDVSTFDESVSTLFSDAFQSTDVSFSFTSSFPASLSSHSAALCVSVLLSIDSFTTSIADVDHHPPHPPHPDEDDSLFVDPH